jgi:multiple sugar transport system ATP-binding protein
MRAEISKLHTRLESTMVYVTHDQVEAMTMGDRIVVMKDGIIQQTDTPLNLYNHPKNRFVAGFIGSPAMNFMRGTIEQSDGLWFKEGRLKLKVAPKHMDKLKNYIGKELTMGIRPEDIYKEGFSVSSDAVSSAQSTVEVVEPMGNEIYLYLNSGNHTYIARISALEEPPVGVTLNVLFDMSKAHYFDVNTEESIVSLN